MSLPGAVQYRRAAGGVLLPAFSEGSICPECGWRGLVSICHVTGWACFKNSCDRMPCDQRRRCTRCGHRWSETVVLLPDVV